MSLALLYSLYSDVQEGLREVFEPNDFYISTWLAMGAAGFLLIQTYFPSSWSSSLLLAFLAYRFFKMLLNTLGLHTTSYTSLKRGRWRAALPESDTPKGTGSDGLVVFLLGARINHPLGKLSPGAWEINNVFQDMWAEAEKNREKWGYLGRTATLVDFSDSERTPTFWISYWRDLKSLQEFANSTAHLVGQKKYDSGKFPYMGIMHELFYAPKGCWKTLYDDMPPWGLGTAKAMLKDEHGHLRLQHTLEPNNKHNKVSHMLHQLQHG